jgi:Saccharopine dehydrogenase NADP binding domain
MVVGASGTVGRRVAAELLRTSDDSTVMCASRGRDAGRSVADLLGPRADALALDVRDPSKVAAAASGCDVIVNAAGPLEILEVHGALGAIAAGIPYVSLNNDLASYDAVRGLHETAVEAGVTIATGCGLSPGITTWLVALAASELDVVEEVEVAVALSCTGAGGDAAADHVGRCLARPDEYVSESKRAAGRAGDVPRLVYFPEPAGWVETFNCAHPEIAMTQSFVRGARSIRYRVGLTERAAMDVTRAAAAIGRAEQSDVFSRVARRIRPLAGILPPRGTQWSAARIDVWGERTGERITISLGVVDHLVNLAGVAATLAAIGLGTGEVRRPGVHAPMDLWPADEFLAALGRKGVRVARLEPELAAN